ncbi:MAG: hypothetical protein Q8P41_31850 [Pseudomonadota bacterium]|nr:hypothetical protein [Pseudomonadota bacterium]
MNRRAAIAALPCRCRRKPTLDDTRFYGEPMVSCCGSATHQIVVYGKTLNVAIRRWNRLVGGWE